jgi:hypothetical protein
VFRRSALAAALLACPLAGCGAERAGTPGTVLPAGAPLKQERFREAGLTLSLPEALEVSRRTPPSVFRATFADWYVAAFAYRRGEQIPRRRPELAAARRRLVAQVRRRDRRFKLIRSGVTRVGRAPAVELVGDQTISRSRLRTRSVHVYRGRAEYVLELVAPVRVFGDLQRAVFDPIVKSVRVTGKVRRGNQGGER